MQVKAPFILVFRPHQRPATAAAFWSEKEVIDGLVNGDFSDCFAQWSDDGVPTFDEALALIAHDLSQLTLLDSREEVARYLTELDFCGRHNKGQNAVADVARRAGLFEEADEADD